MPRNPLAEVFGFPPDNFSATATRHRANKFCPFHNSSGPRCTKNSTTDPLGVCSVLENDGATITCPIRFRQDWIIAADAAAFFFSAGTNYASLTEVRLNDAYGKSAGNIDVVLVSIDAYGRVADFGALEVQAVYISGNVSGPFRYYMENPSTRYAMEWPSKGYPSPDYLSSSRKRLAPQLMFKGGILNAWGKKIAVAVQRPFFATLPQLPRVSRSEAEIAWMIYNLEHNATENRYQLLLSETVYTRFKPALDEITVPKAGPIDRFVHTLERRLKKGQLLGTPEEPEIPPEIEPPPDLME